MLLHIMIEIIRSDIQNMIRVEFKSKYYLL